MNTGADLRRRRLELGLEQIQVANLAGVDNGDLCRTEYDRPRGLNAAGVARVVGVLEAAARHRAREDYLRAAGAAVVEVLAGVGK